MLLNVIKRGKPEKLSVEAAVDAEKNDIQLTMNDITFVVAKGSTSNQILTAFNLKCEEK